MQWSIELIRVALLLTEACKMLIKLRLYNIIIL